MFVIAAVRNITADIMERSRPLEPLAGGLKIKGRGEDDLVQKTAGGIFNQTGVFSFDVITMRQRLNRSISDVVMVDSAQ